MSVRPAQRKAQPEAKRPFFRQVKFPAAPIRCGLKACAVHHTWHCCLCWSMLPWCAFAQRLILSRIVVLWQRVRVHCAAAVSASLSASNRATPRLQLSPSHPVIFIHCSTSSPSLAVHLKQHCIVCLEARGTTTRPVLLRTSLSYPSICSLARLEVQSSDVSAAMPAHTLPQPLHTPATHTGCTMLTHNV